MKSQFIISILLSTASLSVSLCPQDCICKDSVVCSAQSLVIDREFGSSLDKTITILTVQNSNVYWIDPEALKNSKIQHLKFRNNVFRSFNSFVLESVPTSYLILENNTLHFDSPIDFGDVDELIMNDNTVNEFQATAKDMSYFRLVNSNINKIYSFANVIGLEEVNLAKNDISFIPEDTFSDNTELNVIDLSDNKLNGTNGLNLQFLEKLNLTHNLIRELRFDMFSKMTALQYLYLGNNQIDLVEADSFKSARSLRIISLAHNKLGEISEELFKHNSDLEEIDLSYNQLEFLPVFKGNFGILQRLNLAGNNLISIPSNFFHNMRAIYSLNLSNNKLRNIDNTLDYLYSLLKIDISHNQLSDSEFIFSKNVNLKKINAASNRFSGLETFELARSLRELNVSDNWMTQLAFHKDRLVSLVLLSIANNKIRHLDLSLFQNQFSLLAIDLNGNDIECSPSTDIAFNWFIQQQVFVLLPSEDQFNRAYQRANIGDNDGFFRAKWNMFKQQLCPGSELIPIDVTTAKPLVTPSKSLVETAAKTDDDYYYYDDDDDDYSEEEEEEEQHKSVTNPPKKLFIITEDNKIHLPTNDVNSNQRGYDIDADGFALINNDRKLNFDGDDEIDEEEPMIVHFQSRTYMWGIGYLTVCILLTILVLLGLTICIIKKKNTPSRRQRNYKLFNIIGHEVYRDTAVPQVDTRKPLERIFSSSRIQEMLYNFGKVSSSDKEERVEILSQEEPPATENSTPVDIVTTRQSESV